MTVAHVLGNWQGRISDQTVPHRFFFLADYELITVLGGSIKDPKVQALIKKLFVNVSAILPDDLGIIDLLYTTDGEDLPLCKSVNTKINTVEGWLAEMLEETKVCFEAKPIQIRPNHPIQFTIFNSPHFTQFTFNEL